MRFPCTPTTEISILENLYCKFMCMFDSRLYFSRKYLDLLKSHPFLKSTYTDYVWDYTLFGNCIFPTKWFKHFGEMPFDGTKI